jgi:hypothetical protein
MTQSVIISGITYSIPDVSDVSWGQNVTDLLVTLGNNSLKIDGGVQTLSSNVDFGNTYGLFASFFASKASDVASAGRLRLGTADSIQWRNAANTTNLLLELASDKIRFNGIDLVDLSTSQIIRNKTISDPSDTTKQLDFLLSTATASTKTSLRASQTANRILDLPDVTDTLVGKTTIDIFTNKTITDGSNNISASLLTSGTVPDARISSSSVIQHVGSIVHQSLSGAGTNTHAQIDSHIAASSAHGVAGDIVGTTSSQSLTNKTLVSPNIQTDAKLQATAIAKFYDSDNSNFVGYKAPNTISSDVTWTLPDADGSVGQVMRTSGAGVLSWVTVGTAGLTQHYIYVGGAGNIRTELDTSAVGDIQAHETNGLTIKSDKIVNAQINTAAAIDATKIANGTVDNTEFQKLGSVGTDGAGEIVSTDGTQDISNKTFIDNNNVLEDSDDATKKAKIKINSSQAGSSTQTFTLPPVGSNIVTDDSTNVLINKLLASSAAVGKFGVDTLGASAAHTTTFDINHTASRTIVVPDADTNLVGHNTSDVLSNKTLTNPVLNDSGTFDTANAASMNIGGTNATTINVSRTGQTTVIKGNLQVDGTTTTVNSSVLDVVDANITINDGGNQASADGSAGITVEMSDATDVSIIYDSTKASRWKAGDVGSEIELANVSSSQTFTNKILTAPDINGGTADALTSLSIVDNGANTLNIISGDGAFSASRNLTIDLNNAARLLDLAGNLTIAANLITSGANSLTFTTSGVTNVTLPTTGTLATLAGAEQLTGKTLIELANANSLRFYEGTGGGTNYFGLKAPATLTASTTLAWPDGVGSNGQVLSTNGTDTLSWASAATVPAEGAIYSNGTSLNTAGAFAGNGNEVVTVNSGATALEYKKLTSANIDTAFITSGVYTPTMSSRTNCSLGTPTEAQYIRVGSIVTVTGAISSLTVTTTATDTSFYIDLPIAMGSNFAGLAQAAGVSTWGDAGTKDAGYCYSVDSSQNIIIAVEQVSGAGTGNYVYFSFQYEIQ